MMTLYRKTACLALLVVVPWAARAETLADHLPEEVASLEIYAEPGAYHTPFPFYVEDVNGFKGLKSRVAGGDGHIVVTDAAVRAETLARLRAVRLKAVAKERHRGDCAHFSNPLGAWLLGDDAMLVLNDPVEYLDDAAEGDLGLACLAVGGQSHWFDISRADLWQALRPLWRERYPLFDVVADDASDKE
ncbi:MAG: hypothetical protein Q4D61_09120 [Cardiobacteriaceae bacterium]|nr:hypothetical protein [Cardiobacteriaceae bacterium]